MNMKPLALAAVLLMVPGIALARGGHGAGPGGFGPFPFAGADMAQQVAELDADGDGKVTKAELFEGRTARFAAADANGDGALDADELDGLLRAQRQRMLDNLLRRYDGDGNGTVSAEEFASVPTWFERLDADDDGALSEDELARLDRRGHHGRGDGPRDGSGPQGPNR